MEERTGEGGIHLFLIYYIGWGFDALCLLVWFEDDKICHSGIQRTLRGFRPSV